MILWSKTKHMMLKDKKFRYFRKRELDKLPILLISQKVYELIAEAARKEGSCVAPGYVWDEIARLDGSERVPAGPYRGLVGTDQGASLISDFHPLLVLDSDNVCPGAELDDG